MKNVISLLKIRWENEPLPIILFAAAFARLVAVIFAKGWGMLDDHFLVIEVAQSWADGGDVSKWLPSTAGNDGPTGHSFFYVGLHYLFFSFLNLIGLENPQTRMLLVRLIHGGFSMITVYLGYRIAEKLSDHKTGRLVGLLLALLWFMPWLGVRNLVEIVATPLLMISTWMVIKNEKTGRTFYVFFWSGFIAGLAFSVRYQTMFYAGGMGLALLFTKKIKETVFFGLGFLLSVILIQGGIDIFIWGWPFAELEEYVRYNLDNAYNYLTGAWYKYILLFTGILIPPVCIFIFVGFFKNYRKNLLIFLPTFIFFAFHSYFPNKQERFVLTIVPFVIMLGIMGWQEISERSRLMRNNPGILRSIWIFFWLINIIMLIPVTTMYSKRARAESMTYLNQFDRVESIIIENSNEPNVDIVPQFYSGHWMNVYEVTKNKPLSDLPDFKNTNLAEPKFILFFRDDNLEQRLERCKPFFPDLEFETVIHPGFVDELIHFLNPHNKNETIYIYRNAKYFDGTKNPELN